MSRVAVLITNYNNAPWIAACVDSALAQTRPADDVVVFDDGSDDGSTGMLRGYGDRIRLMRVERGSPRPAIERQAEGLEQALALTAAEHIHLLDGDDVYHPERVATYEAAWAARPEAVMVQGPLRSITEEGRPLMEFRYRIPTGEGLREHLRRTHDPYCIYLTSALAFRADFLRRMLPHDFSDGLAVAIDMRLGFEALWAGPVVTLAEPWVDYRFRDGSIAATTGMRGGERLRRIEISIAVFNRIALRRGQPGLKIWRNADWRRHRLRALLPKKLGDALAMRRLRVGGHQF